MNNTDEFFDEAEPPLLSDYDDFSNTERQNQNINNNRDDANNENVDDNNNKDVESPNTKLKVQIIAPATLSAGYTFDVETNGQRYKITVPYGGMKEGSSYEIEVEPHVPESRASFRITVGSWKDHMFNCLSYGPCHPSFLLSCCCPLVAVGQIMTRLNLTWNASKVQDVSYNGPKPFLLAVVITAFVIMIPIPVFIFIYAIILVLMTARVRAYIRRTYYIPSTLSTLFSTSRNGGRNLEPEDDEPTTCSGVILHSASPCEDVLISYFCRPCVISQMIRHTAMYDTYPGACCTPTGLPPHAPDMV